MNDKQILSWKRNIICGTNTDEDLEKSIQLSERYIEFMSKCKPNENVHVNSRL